MNKKLLSLAPLLAIAAFAVMPAVSQAAVGHWFKQHSEIAPGNPEGDENSPGVDIVAWQTLTLTSSVGTATCENAFLGDVYNPSSPVGAAGKATVDAFSVVDCVAPACEGAAVGSKLELKPEGLTGFKGVPTEFNEWEAELIGAGPEFRLRVGNKKKTTAEGGTPTENEEAAKRIQFGLECAVAGIVIKFHGELTPLLKTGTAQGTAPSKVNFDAGSGALESSAGTATTSGELKAFGYEDGAIIGTK